MPRDFKTPPAVNGNGILHHVTDTWANRPSASASNRGLIYEVSDVGDGELFYLSDGAAWHMFPYGQVLKATNQEWIAANNNTTQTPFSCAVPANFLTQGSMFRMRSWGYINHRASADTLTFRVMLPSGAGASANQLMAYGAVMDTTLRTGLFFLLDANFHIETAGSSGNARGSMSMIEEFTGVAASRVRLGGAPAGGTVNTTVASVIRLEVQWNNAHADNDLFIIGSSIEKLR